MLMFNLHSSASKSPDMKIERESSHTQNAYLVIVSDLFQFILILFRPRAKNMYFIFTFFAYLNFSSSSIAFGKFYFYPPFTS